VTFSALRPIGPAIAASAMAVLPLPLVGGLAVLLQEDLGFGEAQLGLSTAAFFAAASASAAPAGRLSEVLDPRRVAWVGLGCIAASLLGIAHVAASWEWLAGFLALAGLGHATTLLAIGVFLTREVAPRRHGLAFGVAQASAPLSALLAGLSLPFVALTLGWQVAFSIAAGVAILVAVMMPPIGRRRPRAGGDLDGDTIRDAPIRALAPLAIGMAMASAAGNSSVVFLVSSTVDSGFTAADAGVLLAIASLIGLVVRVAVGWIGDTTRHGSLLLMVGLIGVGAIGYVALAASRDPIVVAIGSILAFGGGWGWPGLMLLAVSRSNPGAPGAAMGVVTLGGLGGAVVGPLVFGTIAEHAAFGLAWLVMTGFAAGAVAMVLVSRRRILMARPGLPT
jgi:MFS family permease